MEHPIWMSDDEAWQFERTVYSAAIKPPPTYRILALQPVPGSSDQEEFDVVVTTRKGNVRVRARWAAWNEMQELYALDIATRIDEARRDLGDDS